MSKCFYVLIMFYFLDAKHSKQCLQYLQISNTFCPYLHIWWCIVLSPHLHVHLREGVKKNGFIWDFVPNIGPHPPTAHVWDKVVKKHFFYNLWGLKASWNGQVWPPHLCITCFRTFLDVCSKNNWMAIFTKKFGTLDPPLDPPTHSLGQSPK